VLENCDAVLEVVLHGGLLLPNLVGAAMKDDNLKNCIEIKDDVVVLF
jgi:hypothetical protein